MAFYVPGEYMIFLLNVFSTLAINYSTKSEQRFVVAFLSRCLSARYAIATTGVSCLI